MKPSISNGTESINEVELSNDEDLIALETIQLDFIKRIQEQNVNLNDLQPILASGDVNGLKEILGYSDQEILDLDNAVLNHRNALLTKFPELDQYATDSLSDCVCTTGSDTEIAEASFTVLSGLVDIENLPSERFTNNCNWGRYGACLIVSGTFGFVGFLAGGFICYCEYCVSQYNLC